ncbi:MAG: protein disulfide oxidoreductase [Psychromonas sp.]
MTVQAVVKGKSKKSLGKWVKEIFSYLILFIILSWGVDYWRSQSMVSGDAPELITTSVQGEEVDLIALSQDKPVLVYFWATWCGVCSVVSPSVDFISEHYQVVTVALSSGNENRINQYLNAKDYQFNVVNDPRGAVSREWGVSVTPTLFVIDKGEIKSITTGFTSPMGMWLRLLLA